MKLVLFHLVAYLALGVIPDGAEFEGQECSVSSKGLNTQTYRGEAHIPLNCLNGFPVFGDNFKEDTSIRASTSKEDLSETLACCVQIKCGSDQNGYCTYRGDVCRDWDIVTPFSTNECPGFNGQCCPIGRRGTSSSSIESDTGLAFAPDEIMIPGSDADIFGGNFGGGEDLSIFDNNWDDWTSALHSENEDNLFLASDNSADSYGLTAADFGDLGQWENFDA